MEGEAEVLHAAGCTCRRNIRLKERSGIIERDGTPGVNHGVYSERKRGGSIVSARGTIGIRHSESDGEHGGEGGLVPHIEHLRV